MHTKFAFLFLFILPSLFAQNLDQMEQDLNVRLEFLRASTTNEEMDNRNIDFKKELIAFLQSKGSMEHEFKFCKTIAVLDSPDKTVRLITWNIEYTDFTYAFDGVVLYKDPKRKKYVIHSLNDVYQPYSEKPSEIIDGENWYGALYYQMIPFTRRGKTEYLLLGWDGGTPSSNFKLIDVMTVDKSTVKFGSPVFSDGKTTLNRVVFEYSERAKMTLRYEENFKRLVFDHLSPESPSLAGVKSFYVPDMSYDSYSESNGIWNLKTDIIAINNGDNKKDKKNWKDPSGNSVNGIKHVARTPEKEKNEEKIKDDFLPKKKKIRKRDNPNELNITTGKYKPRRKRKYKNENFYD